MMTRIFSVPDKDFNITVRVADTFWTRLVGLMLQKPLPPATGLLITPCNSIHMCFMRFAIDAIFLDRQGKILKIVRNLRPWIGISACWQAYSTLEMTAGEADRLGLEVDQVLRIA
ncbi:DUF192 domain-containing protein [Mitsuokella sp. WILCCON 0060]|uniref:DUF192 domain-containing protein n=1 Tax=Mitsuokella sp. WILCCON 0060 TaxID=3345341 RepID=UPI003F1C4CFF